MSITRDRLQNLLTGWALFTAILPTLIVYRAALQPRYQWGLFGVAGEGVAAGYFIVVAAAALAWCAVVLGNLWPVAGAPAFIVLYAVWFTAITIGAVQLGSKMTVRGDAWGIGERGVPGAGSFLTQRSSNQALRYSSSYRAAGRLAAVGPTPAPDGAGARLRAPLALGVS